MKKIILMILVIISFISCKNDQKAKLDGENKKETAIDLDLFKVNFNLLVKKNDNFHLFYTQDGTINFNEKNSIWLPVKGSENVQTISFKLPKDVMPTHIRVDFGLGKNETQSDVELVSFSINYFDKVIDAKGVEIFNYFYPNKTSTSVSDGTAILKRLKKDQDAGPMLYPHILLTKKLKEISMGHN